MRGAAAGIAWITVALARPAGAWELALDASAACTTPEALRARVDAQRTGADPPLALAITIEGVADAWRAGVDVREADVAQGRREVAGTSCDEVVAAAALIAAMALDRAGGPAAPIAPAPAPSDAVTTFGGEPLVLRQPRAEPVEPARPRAFDFAVRLAAGVDVFGLPGPSPGARIEVDAGRGRARVAFGAAWNAEVEDTDADGKGLALGMTRFDARARVRLGAGLAIGVGGELGRISGRGIGVDTALDRATAWWAVLGDASWTIALADELELMLSIEMVKPLNTLVFSVDGVERFRPGLTLRGYGGVGFLFD